MREMEMHRIRRNKVEDSDDMLSKNKRRRKESYQLL
jgi:hypothetical protein